MALMLVSFPRFSFWLATMATTATPATTREPEGTAVAKYVPAARKGVLIVIILLLLVSFDLPPTTKVLCLFYPSWYLYVRIRVCYRRAIERP
jgi:hypothetical protein